MKPNVKVCTSCVMDTSDANISFNSHGVCCYCTSYESHKNDTLKVNDAALSSIIKQIKDSGKGREYDCVIGLSGGVDSSYLAYLAKQHGLSPLVVHVDSGWNSELAVHNIESIVKHLDFDLYTHVVDWEEMKDLQLSFFKAGVANADIPQDHVFPAVLYKLAAQYNIKYILSGGNFATESILPRSWGYTSKDLVHIKDIQRKLGSRKLKKYPMLSLKKEFYYRFVRGIKTVRLLNYIHYQKAQAKQIIQNELGWRDYGGKHYESVFTRFFQGAYLIDRFNIDKRKAHLSSLILNHEMTRGQALIELAKPALDEKIMLHDKAFLASKMGVSLEEFEQIVQAEPRPYQDYKNIEKHINFLIKMKRKIGW